MPAYPWAKLFDDYVHQALMQRNNSALTNIELAGDAAKLFVSTAEHYLPLLYVVGASENDPISLPTEGFQNTSLSTRSVQFR